MSRTSPTVSWPRRDVSTFASVTVQVLSRLPFGRYAHSLPPPARIRPLSKSTDFRAGVRNDLINRPVRPLKATRFLAPLDAVNDPAA